jgi:lipid-A-disaccharide synthase
MPIDILILSNGPGELATWVRPIVKALRQQMGDDHDQVRISLVLSPCPNASGKEAAIARTYGEIDRVQAAEHFFPFLLWGKTADRWDWRSHGVVVFLGGDQFYSVVIGKRLGYRIVAYAEWQTRWHRWVDRFGVMNPSLVQHAPVPYADKLTVVGDLMAESGDREWGRHEELSEIERSILSPPAGSELIGLLPGSKAAKLAQGVPLALATAQQIHAKRPQTHFVIPVAPTLDVSVLARFADPGQNPVLQQFGEIAAELVLDQEQPFFKLADGLRIDLWTRSPAYDLLSQCRLCLTTIGANTAELGALAVPMIVLIPLQQMDAMRAWDGLPGMLANLPGIGRFFALGINHLAYWWYTRQTQLFAWPNIWADEAIVPELVGKLQPDQVADFVLNFLEHPERLAQMQTRLRQVRGEPGAAQKLAQLVQEVAGS